MLQRMLRQRLPPFKRVREPGRRNKRRRPDREPFPEACCYFGRQLGDSRYGGLMRRCGGLTLGVSVTRGTTRHGEAEMAKVSDYGIFDFGYAK